VIDSFGRQFGAHAEPVGFAVLSNQYVGENDLTRACKGFVDDGVISGVDIANNTENALFDIYTPDAAFSFAQVSNIITNDGLADGNAPAK
jgi:hypothetical protein